MQWCRSSGFLPRGQKSEEGCMEQLMPVLARLSPSGRSDSSVAWPEHSVRLVELRGSLASDPLLPWRFALSPCLTPALICICYPACAEVVCPRCLPVPVPCSRVWGAAIADFELLPPPGAHYMQLPLQLPGAWTESREMAHKALVKPSALSATEGGAGWASLPAGRASCPRKSPAVRQPRRSTLGISKCGQSALAGCGMRAMGF